MELGDVRLMNVNMNGIANAAGSHGNEGYENKAYSGSELNVSAVGEGKPNGNGQGANAYPVISNKALTNRKPHCSAEVTDIPYEMRCGLRSCRPDFLQKFNNPKAFLAWLCWFSFLQGFIVNGINNVNTTTLERRFQLSSSAAGTISSSYDISAGILVIPVSYFGAHAHQPRMLTFAAMFMCCGAFLMSVPHFGSGLYDLGDSQADECMINANITSSCTEADSNIHRWLGVLILGMILNGVGGTILYSIGIVFLDSSVSTKSSPLYQAFLTSSAALGPAVGYLLGGYFVESFYVDFDRVDPVTLNLSPDDPRFVGAWWLGFVAAGVLLFTVVLLLMCYPMELPATKAARQKRTIEVHNDGSMDIASREGFGTTLKDMPQCLKLLLTNPVFLCLNLAGITASLTVSGLATFMPKFIQNQFSLTAGLAAIVGGACAVPGVAGGQFAGGLISKVANLKIKGMLLMNMVTSVIATFVVLVMFCRCSPPDFAGVNTRYDNISVQRFDVDLDSACNAECGCTSLSYEPICGVNNIQYFSPCHAGCRSSMVNNSKVYLNCTCIDPPNADQDYATMATEGTCDTSCPLYYVFLPLFFLVIFLFFMNAVPSLTVTLRCVPESQRSFAVGVQWVFIRLLGSIPGPVLMGYVFDSTCTVWQEKCGSQGSCWVYDNKLLSERLVIMTVCVKCMSTLFFVLAYKFYKPPPGGLQQLRDRAGSIDTASSLDNINSNGTHPSDTREKSVPCDSEDRVDAFLDNRNTTRF